MSTTEWNAASYHQINSLQQWLGEESLAQLKLRGDEQVLDIGCGDGRLSAEVAARCAFVLGVDPSRQMVDYARKTYPLPNLSFEYGDARELSYDGRFDLIISFNALHWVPRADFPRTMNDLRRALKPGGRAHLRFVGKGPRQALEAVISEVAADHAAPFTHFTLDEFYALAGECGFGIESMGLLDRHWDFPEGGFAEWARTTFVAWTSRLSPEDSERFIADALERYARMLGRPNRFAFYQLLSDLVLL